MTGALLVGLGVSGLIDDSGALSHPYWIVPIAAAIAVCLATAAATLRKLL